MTARKSPEAPDPDGGSDAGPVTEGTLFGGRLRLCQPADGYRVAVDPVLLAAAIPATAGDRVLDAGSGVGAAALCLAHRLPGCRVEGIEIQPSLTALAVENAESNGVTETVRFTEGDIGASPANLEPGAFDHVMTNPPYLRADESRSPRSSSKAIATVEQELDLDAWLGNCIRMTRPRGTVTVIHRADRLDDVIRALSVECGALVVFPLWPKAGEDAKRMIVRATVGRETPLRLAPGLVLHDENGDYTREAEAILRDAAALEL
tara:strand:+ start:798 stop:1586 length:789 start_codon:yes stop_codon:yes gene_type:complete